MNPTIRILVLQRGWVVVGAVSQQGSQIEVTGASVVRRWGTSRGLGELAAKGPLSDTVLDPAGTVRVHELAVVMAIDCNPDKWSVDTCKQ